MTAEVLETPVTWRKPARRRIRCWNSGPISAQISARWRASSSSWSWSCSRSLPISSRRIRRSSPTTRPSSSRRSGRQGGSLAYPLGTDAIGRDILSRLIHGARLSLLIGIAVVALSVVAGTILGLVAGFFRGVIEIAIMRLMDITLTLPSLLLAIVIVAILGPGMMNAMLAVAIVLLAALRADRARRRDQRSLQGLRHRGQGRGAGRLRLMFKEVLPNCAAPLIVQATLGISTAILDAAALGFLGLGAQPPSPEWGTMLADAREFVLRAWWVVTLPGLAILVTVLAFNLLGDGLRDALDPKLKR